MQWKHEEGRQVKRVGLNSVQEVVSVHRTWDLPPRGARSIPILNAQVWTVTLDRWNGTGRRPKPQIVVSLVLLTHCVTLTSSLTSMYSFSEGSLCNNGVAGLFQINIPPSSVSSSPFQSLIPQILSISYMMRAFIKMAAERCEDEGYSKLILYTCVFIEQKLFSSLNLAWCLAHTDCAMSVTWTNNLFSCTGNQDSSGKYGLSDFHCNRTIRKSHEFWPHFSRSAVGFFYLENLEK